MEGAGGVCLCTGNGASTHVSGHSSSHADTPPVRRHQLTASTSADTAHESGTAQSLGTRGSVAGPHSASGTSRFGGCNAVQARPSDSCAGMHPVSRCWKHRSTSTTPLLVADQQRCSALIRSRVQTEGNWVHFRTRAREPTRRTRPILHPIAPRPPNSSTSIRRRGLTDSGAGPTSSAPGLRCLQHRPANSYRTSIAWTMPTTTATAIVR